MMKANSKKSIVFVLSLSILQAIVVSPIAFATEKTTENSVSSVPETGTDGGRINRQGDRMQKRWENINERKTTIEDRQGNRQATMTERQDTRLAASCDRINAMGQNHFQQFSEKKSTLDQNFGDKMTAFEDRRDSNDAKLNDDHEKQDEQRNEMYMRLGDFAKTDDQKAAVEAFQKTVDQAVTDRRSAVSEAIDAFRKDVDALVATKKSSVRVSVDTFQESTKTAFDKAKTDCSSGVDPKTVRDTLTTSLKDARTKLETNRQSFEGLGKSIPAIASAKKTSIDKAMQDFKTTMEKARTDLKAALQ